MSTLVAMAALIAALLGPMGAGHLSPAAASHWHRGTFRATVGILSQGTVQGTVSIGPGLPNCPPPCGTTPYAADVHIYNATKSFVAHSSAIDGAYSIRIPVGNYTVKGLQSGLYPKAPPAVAITVLRNAVVVVNLLYDSGIR